MMSTSYAIILLIVLLIALCFSLGACRQEDHVSAQVLKGEPGWAVLMDSWIYERDADYIKITVQNRLSKLWNRPGYLDSVSVDSIFYSPDRLKLFAFVVERKKERKNFVEKTGITHTYGSDAYVGFRDRVGQPWQLYSFDLGLLGTYETPERAKQVLRWLYFRKLKTATDFVLNKDDEWEEERYGANLGERAFWSSMLWRQGTRSQGMYIFQTYRWLPTGTQASEQVRIKEFEPIDYPQDLLRLFEREGIDAKAQE